jgi:hypothetical protein
MALTEGQWQVRDLVIGAGTGYRLMDDTNPFTVTVRADQGGPRAWNHGSWSGAEWVNERVVPLRLLVEAAGGDTAAWLAAHQQLAAAFAPVADAGDQVELRFMMGGDEYLLLGRPRMVEPETSLIALGKAFTRAAFVAQDPRIYSGELFSTGAVTLPSYAGGLLVPLTVPFNINSTLVGGAANLANTGTAPAGLSVRVDGPVSQPRVGVRQPDGTLQEIVFLSGFDLPAGQWIEIDTAARTALLNGLPQASVRGQASWEMDPFPLLPGTNVLRFGASSGTGTATATYRSAWW